MNCLNEGGEGVGVAEGVEEEARMIFGEGRDTGEGVVGGPGFARLLMVLVLVGGMWMEEVASRGESTSRAWVVEGSSALEWIAGVCPSVCHWIAAGIRRPDSSDDEVDSDVLIAFGGIGDALAPLSNREMAAAIQTDVGGTYIFFCPLRCTSEAVFAK